MTVKIKRHISSYGIKVLLSPHPEIRRLKRSYVPSVHGTKFWPSSWLLMDFFRRRGLRPGRRVMELGCGWGLAGIYCAKKHRARVTGVDMDADVFPYLQLHAEINKVEIATMARDFDRLRGRELAQADILIGADICFWDSMAASLKRLIRRALKAGVQRVVIADPGRSPFEELTQAFVHKGAAEVMDWSIRRPRPIRGRILQIRSPAP